MILTSRKRKRIKLFSSRPQLRFYKKAIEKATYELDAAEVEELMEEKQRYINDLMNSL